MTVLLHREVGGTVQVETGIPQLHHFDIQDVLFNLPGTRFSLTNTQPTCAIPHLHRNYDRSSSSTQHAT